MSQSPFEDLMNLEGTTDNSNQSDDPFDFLGISETTTQSNANTGDSLLDLGFDVQVSTKNEPVVEVNTNPLYEFTKTNDTLDIMATEADSVLLDFGGGEPQKEVKSDPSNNPLYDFLESEKTDPSNNPLYDFLESEKTNGHMDDDVVLTNGDNQTTDLLDDSNDQVDLLGGPITATSDDSGVTMDMNNISETREEDVTTEDIVEEEVKVVEEEVKVVEEEIEDDQDTGNVEDIGSEQITEPEVEDQLDEQEEQEGPVNNIENEPEIAADPAPVEELQDNGVDEKEALDEETNGEMEEVRGDEAEDIQDEKPDVDEERLEQQDEPIQEGVPQSVEDEEVKLDNVEVDQAEKPELTEETTPAETDQTNAQAEIDQTAEQIEAVEEKENDDAHIKDAAELESAPTEISSEPVPDTVSEPEQAKPEETAEPETVPAEPEIEMEEPEPEKEELEPVNQTEEVLEKTTVADVETAPVQEASTDDIPQSEVVEECVESPEVVGTGANDLQESQPEQLPEIAVEEQPEMETITEEVPEQTEEPEPISDEISSPDLADVNEAVNVAEPIVEAVIEDTPVVEPVQEESLEQDQLEIADEDNKKKEDVVVKEKPAETKSAPEQTEEKAVKVNGTNDVKENGLADEEVIRDPNIVRETREKEEVHFAEMNNVRQKFESGAVQENEPTPKKVSVREEYDQGGEFESTPIVNEDVVKETDQQKEELPEIGSAKNLMNRFKSLQEESAQTVTSQKRNSPPRDEKVEYESQPTQSIVVAESKSDEGVFESTPKEIENVVRSGEKTEDVKTAEGHTKNLLNRFKDIQTESSEYKVREKRELTPDKSGKVEYVSEPRGEHITYDETKTESGVYENVPKEEEDVIKSGEKAEEAMPESGMAKNLLSKFKQLESETVNNAPPSPKRGKPYEPKPKEQKGYLERYSPKLEEGEFENQPVVPAEVVRSGDVAEDVKPESGTAKKTLERFKSMEQTSSPPKAPDYRKDFTPPREASPGKTVAGVLENQPEIKPDVIRNVDKPVEEMPEQGTAKNILEKFKQIQSAENSPSESPTKRYKEFTPPPEAGVYENTPNAHLVIEQRQSETGVLESTPTKSVADIPREEREIISPEKELPEKGMAKNLVSKFKQLESESAKTSQSTSPRYKEFTPPRDTRNILSPKSPAEHQNGVHPSDLPEQYQEQVSPGIFESDPEVRKDVYRESDTDYAQGLPAKNTTMSMLEKFRNIQQKAKDGDETPSPVTRKDDTPSPLKHDAEAKDVQHE